MLSANISRLSCSLLVFLSLTGIIIPKIQAQEKIEMENPSSGSSGDEFGESEEELINPNNLRPLSQSDSIFSLEGGKKIMSEALEAIDQQEYELAINKFQQARKIFNQLSNFYLQIANSFSGIDGEISGEQKRKAFETGQMRDEATYQLALAHRAQNQAELAVPLLIQIIRSQQPTSELGKKSYQQLYEIGFVDTPFDTSNK